MIALTRPESLLVKFLFTAPFLLATLTITCEAQPKGKPAADPARDAPEGDPPDDRQAPLFPGQA
jgi:hypothetical protein